VSAVAFVLAAYSQVGLMNVVPLAYSTLISQLQDGLIVIDTNAIIQEVNPTAEQITGLKRSDVIGEPANQVAHPSFPELTEALSAAFSRREVHVTEGERPGCYEFIVSPLHTDAGDLVGRMLVWHDISERKQLEERLRYASSHDYLTGLYNRTFYEEQLALVRKSRTWPTTVIALDLDNLKLINDQYGHASGDQLLKRAARVLSTCLRKGDIVARVGGDEFMVIMQNSSEQDAKIICERMLSLTQAENDAHPEMILQFSVGFAAAADASALDDAIACADQMMYLDKSRHKYPRP
jgi:diguanylate cyclase (GGDEF)-like protein/PAS domain S-box-containing protein